MNVQNIYAELQVEPFKVNVTEQIHLTARIVDPIHFVFIPEYWEAALKPYKKSTWKHERACFETGFTPWGYSLKQGAFLAFPQFNMTQGGFYAAHLYAVVKEFPMGEQIHAQLTVEGLVMERRVEGKVVQRVELKPRGLSKNDTPYHAVLGLP